MLELLDYTYMQRALVAGILIGGLCSLIGVYVVLRGLAFIGAGIAHASFAGVAIGIWGGFNPIGAAIVFCSAVALGIGFVTRRGRVREDTAVGIFFASSMALGVVILGLVEGYQVDLFGYLFGNIIAVTQADVWMTVGVGALVLACVWLLFKDLMYMAFDMESAEVSGLPAPALYYLLLVLIALTIVISIKVVGIILVEALMVIPAASAYQLTESFRKMLLLSVLFGIGCSIAGLFISAWLQVAPGAAIILLATLIFALCAGFSPKRHSEKQRSGASR